MPRCLADRQEVTANQMCAIAVTGVAGSPRPAGDLDGPAVAAECGSGRYLISAVPDQVYVDGARGATTVRFAKSLYRVATTLSRPPQVADSAVAVHAQFEGQAGR